MGFKILNFITFWGFQKNEYFGGMKILWILFWGHHKLVISMYFRVFSLGQGTEWGIFLGVGKISNIFVMLEIPDFFFFFFFFFWGGGRGGGTVDARPEPKYEEKMRLPPPPSWGDLTHSDRSTMSFYKVFRLLCPGGATVWCSMLIAGMCPYRKEFGAVVDIHNSELFFFSTDTLKSEDAFVICSDLLVEEGCDLLGREWWFILTEGMLA